ncbi:MAG: hypothetical protein Q7S50_04845 [bacterium]|nr:hypothetical protein [bacterium]
MRRNHILLAAGALVCFGIMVRLLPHLPNATPITAIAFAGSIYLGKRWSMLLPLCALFLSDMFIGFYDWKIMASVYGSFALIGCWSWMSRKYSGVLPVFLSVIASSLFFFLITNAAVWLFSPWYEKSIFGLLYSYELGIPFLRNMLTGDIVYTASLLGAFELMRAGVFRSLLPKFYIVTPRGIASRVGTLETFGLSSSPAARGSIPHAKCITSL